MSPTKLVDLTPAPSFRLDGRRALVTGAGRGIGLTAASALAEQASMRVRRYGGRNVGDAQAAE
jgi:NAD(P)-dependent dehydrogenase (short-subunit alcohol dehydrogenase family)